MVEYHQPTYPFIAQQTFGAAKQTALHTAIGERRTVNFVSNGIDFSRRALTTFALYKLTGLAYHLRNHLYRATRIVFNVLIDSLLPGHCG